MILNNIKKRIIKLVLGVFLLLLTIYLTNLYLKTNFAYSGESYYKGSGLLLREDFWKAIFFLTMQQFLISSIVFYLIFSLVNRLTKRWLYRFLVVVWSVIIGLVLIYTGLKIYDLFYSDFTNKEKLIEIVLTWFFRALGFVLGYVFANKNFGLIIDFKKQV